MSMITVIGNLVADPESKIQMGNGKTETQPMLTLPAGESWQKV